MAEREEGDFDTFDFLDVDEYSWGSDKSSSEVEDEELYYHFKKYGIRDAPSEPVQLARARSQAPRVPRRGSFESNMITPFDVERWCALPFAKRAAALDELLRKTKATRQADRESAVPRAQVSMMYKQRVLEYELKDVLTRVFFDDQESAEPEQVEQLTLLKSVKVEQLLRTQPMPTLLKSLTLRGFPFVAIVNVDAHGGLRFRRTKRSLRTVTFEVPRGAVISRINMSPHSNTYSSVTDVSFMRDFLTSLTTLMQSPPLDPTLQTLELTRPVVDANVKRTRAHLLSKNIPVCTADTLDITERMNFLGQLTNLQALTFFESERVLDKVLSRDKKDESRITGVDYIVPGGEPQPVFPSNLDEKPESFRLSSVVTKLYRTHNVRHFVIVDWSCSNYDDWNPYLGEVNVRHGISGGGYAVNDGTGVVMSTGVK